MSLHLLRRICHVVSWSVLIRLIFFIPIFISPGYEPSVQSLASIKIYLKERFDL